MRLLPPLVAAIVACGAFFASTVAEAGRFGCRGPVVAPVGGFGSFFTWSRWGCNAGFGCGPRSVSAGWCGPAWCAGPCWCGTTTWRAVDSVFLALPGGGGATFFSGAVVPVPGWGWGWGCGCGYPTNWLPGWLVFPGGAVRAPCAVPVPASVGPQFGPAGVMPFLGLSNAPPAGRAATGQGIARGGRQPRPVIAAAALAGGRGMALHASSAAARRRAARLVAIGDHHLRTAGQDASQLRLAADDYRRAAMIAQDQADIHVRHALALFALGRDGPADEALARAAAVDGRLRAAPVARDDAAADVVFGDRPAGEPAPLAALGAAVLREIGAGPAADAAGVARLADQWARRWQAPNATVAAMR